MRVLERLGIGGLALAFVGVCTAPVTVRAGTPGEPAAIEPIVAIANGDIAACGFVARGTATAKEPAIHASFRAIRDGSSIVFEIAAGRPGAGGGSEPVRDVSLTTGAYASRTLFPPVAGGTTSARIKGFDGAALVQSLFVSGGTFWIVDQTGATSTLELPSPMPHSVRQAYLNCAGDLFRPDGN